MNRFVPPIVLEDLLVNNRVVRADDGTGILSGLLNEAEVINLQYNQNNLSIDYKALNFINSEMNRYAYKLEGYDKDWNHVGERSTAYYTNLRPGTYLFHVKACNNDGVWNEEGKTLKIVITPPLWATWYAFPDLWTIADRSVLRNIPLFQCPSPLEGKVENGAERETATGRVSSGKDASVHEFCP